MGRTPGEEEDRSLASEEDILVEDNLVEAYCTLLDEVVRRTRRPRDRLTWLSEDTGPSGEPKGAIDSLTLMMRWMQFSEST